MVVDTLGLVSINRLCNVAAAIPDTYGATQYIYTNIYKYPYAYMYVRLIYVHICGDENILGYIDVIELFKSSVGLFEASISILFIIVL